ncbi:MAG: hypothetical protein ACP5MG_08290 [Verrucomicrobiia bacterium]
MDPDSSDGFAKSQVWGVALNGTLQCVGGIGGLLMTVIHKGVNPGIYFPMYDGNRDVIGYLSREQVMFLLSMNIAHSANLCCDSVPMSKYFNNLLFRLSMLLNVAFGLISKEIENVLIKDKQ